MNALLWDGEKLEFRRDAAMPDVPAGWARIRVSRAGICSTDHEILKGYKDFSGIPGHEFVGVVEECEDRSLLGKRVTGEINVGCGRCEMCLSGMERHCPERRTLGINGLDGCMAEYCVLPEKNLVVIPGNMDDEEAVLVEPLAAACEILEQVSVGESHRIAVLGDGRLGILCAWVLSTVSRNVSIFGHHEDKLAVAEWNGIDVGCSGADSLFDFVVEATGTSSGLEDAIRMCGPRGTIVLKTTVAGLFTVDLSRVVVDEISIRGSRCGRFSDALELLSRRPDMPLSRLVTDRFPLSKAHEALECSAGPDSIKVILDPAA